MERTTVDIATELESKRGRLDGLRTQLHAIVADLDASRAKRVTQLVNGEKTDASVVATLESEAEAVQEAVDHLQGQVQTLRAELAEAEEREVKERQTAAYQTAKDAVEDLRQTLRTFGAEEFLPRLDKVRSLYGDAERISPTAYNGPGPKSTALFNAGVGDIVRALENYMTNDPAVRMQREQERQAAAHKAEMDRRSQEARERQEREARYEVEQERRKQAEAEAKAKEALVRATRVPEVVESYL